MILLFFNLIFILNFTIFLYIDIPIFEETIQTSKLAIPPNSEQETDFIKDVISNFSNLDTSNIESIDKLEQIVN